MPPVPAMPGFFYKLLLTLVHDWGGLRPRLPPVAPLGLWTGTTADSTSSFWSQAHCHTEKG